MLKWKDRHPSTKLHRNICESCKKSYDKNQKYMKEKYRNNKEYREDCIERQIVYNKEHPEIFKSCQEIYYDNHKEDILLYHKEYCKTHKKILKEKWKQKYENVDGFKDSTIEQVYAWRDNNREWYNFYMNMKSQGIKVNKKDYDKGKYNSQIEKIRAKHE